RGGADRRRGRLAHPRQDRAADVEGGGGRRRAVLRRRLLERVLQRDALHQRQREVAAPAGAALLRAAGRHAARLGRGPGRRRDRRGDRAAGEDGGDGARRRADPRRLPVRAAALHQGRHLRRGQGLTWGGGAVDPWSTSTGPSRRVSAAPPCSSSRSIAISTATAPIVVAGRSMNETGRDWLCATAAGQIATSDTSVGMPAPCICSASTTHGSAASLWTTSAVGGSLAPRSASTAASAPAWVGGVSSTSPVTPERSTCSRKPCSSRSAK